MDELDKKTNKMNLQLQQLQNENIIVLRDNNKFK